MLKSQHQGGFRKALRRWAWKTLKPVSRIINSRITLWAIETSTFNSACCQTTTTSKPIQNWRCSNRSRAPKWPLTRTLTPEISIRLKRRWKSNKSPETWTSRRLRNSCWPKYQRYHRIAISTWSQSFWIIGSSKRTTRTRFPPSRKTCIHMKCLSSSR